MSRGPKKKEKTLAKELGVLLAKTLLPDLRSRAKAPAVDAVLRQRWEHERGDDRTAERFEDWAAQLIEQVGAAWVLSCVFVRTLEDRGLVSRRRIAGEGAADSEHYFYEIAPSLNARDYLLTVFKELSRFPGTEELLGPRGNPAWRLAPSGVAAQALLDFFRETKEDGALRWTFGAPAAGGPSGESRAVESSTRFLGDLYQDLSESVRERYALLQTPDFVERFILGLTLDPAIREFGLEEVRVIDPTCGSGHFLLGAYDRLFEARLAEKPGLDRRVHALAALEQVFGVDINPYAVAIARFRLTLAYIEKSGEKLGEVPKLPDNLVVADSLLYAAKGLQVELVERASSKKEWGDSLFTLENPGRANSVLSRGYHVVVGNPPYITCKDAKLREKYRKLYPRSAAGKYALAAPFTERFFQLAAPSGFVGLINANSFMKREFGKKLIEEVLPRFDLARIIDLSGIALPGHGTPTVILMGRNRKPMAAKIHTVLGKRGDPPSSDSPENRKVWPSVVGHLDEVGFENEYVTIADMERATFEKHPWSLGGGGAAELKELLESRCEKRLSDLVESVGISLVLGEDEVFSVPSSAVDRFSIRRPNLCRPLLEGEGIRDWSAQSELSAIGPYDNELTLVRPDLLPSLHRRLWPFRTHLWNRAVFSGGTYRLAGRPWYEWHQLTRQRFKTPFFIAFAFVATHNHFVLDRGGKVFNRSAPIIKLPEGATEEEHLALLGYLNSSTACFWMKQSFFDKGNRGEGGGVTAEKWEKFFEYDGTKLHGLPVPGRSERLLKMAGLLDLAGRQWSENDPAVISSSGELTGARLSAVEADRNDLESKMRWLQEELDWEVYGLLGLPTITVEHVPDSLKEVPGRLRGSRPSDVLYAREALQGGESSRYFELCGLPSPSEILESQPVGFDAARLELIASNPELQLIEVPAYKRTFRESQRAWNPRPAIAQWLLSRVEELVAQTSPAEGPVSMRAVLERAMQGVDGKVAKLGGVEEPGSLASLVQSAAVPSLAVMRFTPAGSEKHAAWQHTWDLQRREDAGEKDLKIPVPPKYDQKDYRDPIYWRLRGKLDVPKERFISYPNAERDDDRSPLIGWAGWDHLQRAQALVTLYQERKSQDGWEKERLQPLLAGLLELVPWLKQWHNAPDDDPARDHAGDAYATFVDTEGRALGFTLDDLRAWRPEERKGRKNGKPRAAQPADGAADKQLAMPLSPEDAAPTQAKTPRRKRAKAEESAE